MSAKDEEREFTGFGSAVRWQQVAAGCVEYHGASRVGVVGGVPARGLHLISWGEGSLST